MNLYRAGILTLDLFLLDYIFPNAKLSESDISYLHQLISFGLISSLAHEIVMSMPSLYKAGAVFLIFPARQAARVLGGQYKQYVLHLFIEKIALEIPVAIAVANTIRAMDDLQSESVK